MSAKIAVLGLVIEEPGPPHRLTAKLRQRLASAEFVDSNVYSALTRLEREGFVRAVGPDDPASAPVPGSGPLAPGTRGARLALVGEPGVAPSRGRVTGAAASREQVAGAAASRGQVAGAAPGRGQVTAAAPGRGQVAGAAPGRGQAAAAERFTRRRPPGRRSPGARGDTRSFEATPAGVRHFEQWLLGSSSAPPLRDELHMKVALCQPHNLPRLIELVYGQELVCLSRVQELRRSFQGVAPPTPDRWSGLVLVHVRDAELSFWEARLTWLQGVRESLERMRSEYEGARRRVP